MSGIIKSEITNVDIRLAAVHGTEYLLVEDGELYLYVSKQIVNTEKYIIVWKKENGQWKLFRDIFNSNLPAK